MTDDGAAPPRVLISSDEARPFLGLFPAGLPVALESDALARGRSLDEVEFWVPAFRSDLAATAALLPRLEVLQLMLSGHEAVPVDLLDRVRVHTAAGVPSAAVSEWVLAAILAVTRGLRARVLPPGSGERVASGTLDGKRVTILGYGSIGKSLARRLSGFDVEIAPIASRPGPGVHGPDELLELAAGTDVLAILVPHTPATAGLVSAEVLAALPDDAIVVNAARGEVVDQDALVRELRAGRLRAALDVAVPDPLPPDHELRALGNVLYSPHVAAFTDDLHARIFGFVAEQAERYAAGEPLRNPIRR